MTQHWLIYPSNTAALIESIASFLPLGTPVRWHGDGGPATAAGWLRSLWRHLPGVHPFPGSVLRLGQSQEEVHRHPAWIQRHNRVWLDMTSPLQSYHLFLFFTRADRREEGAVWKTRSDLKLKSATKHCEETAVQRKTTKHFLAGSDWMDLCVVPILGENPEINHALCNKPPDSFLLFSSWHCWAICLGMF